MPKSTETIIPMHEVKAQFLQAAATLWDKHTEEITKVLTESETSKMNVTCTVAIDFSESAKVETTLKFSQVVKDSIKHTFPEPQAKDPNQPTLFDPASPAAEMAAGQEAAEPEEGEA